MKIIWDQEMGEHKAFSDILPQEHQFFCTKHRHYNVSCNTENTTENAFAQWVNESNETDFDMGKEKITGKGFQVEYLPE